MKHIKEKENLIKMSLALGLEPDPKLVKEVSEYRQMLADIKTSRVDISEIFEEMSSIKKEIKKEVKRQPIELPKPPSIDELEFLLEEEEVVEEVKEVLVETLSAPLPPSLDDLVKELNIELDPPKSLIERVSKHISDEVKYENNSFLKEQEDDSPQSLRELKSKVKYLEQWISRIASTGPGSGEVNLLKLDDVDITNLGDSKFLRYNATNAKLEFATVSGGGGGGAVDSVNGLTGDVVLTTANVAESGNLYFSNTRVVEALTAGTNITIAANGLISANVSGGGASVDLTSVSSNIIPDTDQLYNLGSSDKRWGTLFLANNTIDLGGSLIQSDGTGTITISGTGAVLPAGSKVNVGQRESQIALVSNTGSIVTVVPFFTQVLGLNTIATNFEFGANPDDFVFTNFTLSAGTTLEQASVAQFYF